MYDFIIKNANLFGSSNLFLEETDIVISNGKTIKWQKGLHKNLAKNSFDARNMLVSPSFVNTHVNLDKSYITTNKRITDFASAKKEFSECITKMYSNYTKNEIRDDIYLRAKKALDSFIAEGTLYFRNFVTIDDVYEELSFEVAKQLKEEYSEKINMQNAVYYTKENSEICKKLLDNNEINALGLELNDNDEYKELVDTLMEFANKYQISLCFDLNHTDKKGSEVLTYICNKTMENCLQGRVACSHLLFLRYDNQENVDMLVALLARAGVGVEIMPSTDLNMADWKTRGLTVVKSMLNEGVTLSIAIDNIKNVFSPLGNTKYLEEILLTAQILKMSTYNHFAQLFELTTYSSAVVLNNETYGIIPNSEATYNVFDKKDLKEAVLFPCDIRMIVKKGVADFERRA